MLPSNKLFIGFHFKHPHECNKQDVRQGRGETYYSGSGGKGLPQGSFAIRVGDQFVVKQKTGDRGLALRVTDDDRGRLGHLQCELVTVLWTLTEKIEV